jgi:hypothetical protein
VPSRVVRSVRVSCDNQMSVSWLTSTG